MGWVKIEDKYARNPKIMQAGPVAMALDVSGMGYSREHNTSGFIPEHALPLLGPVQGAALRKALKALEQVHRWRRDDELNGWWIHDYLEFNPTDEEDRESAAKRSEQARQAALTRWAKRAVGNAPASDQQCQSDAGGDAEKMPPSPPPPTNEETSSSSEPLDALRAVEEDERLRTCWRGIALRKLKRQRDRGKEVGADGPWLAEVQRREREEHYERAAQLVHDFPDITVDQLVSVLMGETGSLKYLRRREAS